MQYPNQISKLIDSFMKLPGIGEKTAARLAFYIFDLPEDDVSNFARNLLDVKRNLHYCKICGNITEDEVCDICQDQTRDRTQIMVVAQPKEIISFERSHEYHGLYHVLHGLLSPLEGTGPEDINIVSLIKRLRDDTVKEVIIGTDATPEGEATASYLSRLIKPVGIKVTRLAHGLAVGSDIEYADDLTLMRAFEGRTEIK
ncbi:recombination mediator RecR [Xylocopilactobacillus apicola]|uniref:Recombination protein RecR n=1 Tax=Xylocopilactobacillus apicola TaxID=2932184 RepID=A0AAU9CXP9_9LACO|nr:recombination mediator RecR [Xylocopilactobacillus apicola]BDR58777.1 recombination protein RecR [Xylocopilactobacillus apicola]